MIETLKVCALAGGVGGAKLANGLAQVLPAGNLAIVVNTGDDFNHLGLRICPDLDTVLYTLAGVANPKTGWGRNDESWHAYETFTQLGAPDWFRLGDRDLGVHLARTQLLAKGLPLSHITRYFCRSFQVPVPLLPMSDDNVPTLVLTAEGALPFQEYFVQHQCRPAVLGFNFPATADSLPAPGVLEAVEGADVVVICPSNPWVSIDPILAVPGILAAVANRPVVAVSPIISGKTLKGPAAKMFAELGIQPSSSAVADHYRSFLRGFVLHQSDADEQTAVEQWGIMTLATDVIMPDLAGQQRLAVETLVFAEKILGG